jgi:hypothetical protein
VPDRVLHKKPKVSATLQPSVISCKAASRLKKHLQIISIKSSFSAPDLVGVPAGDRGIVTSSPAVLFTPYHLSRPLLSIVSLIHPRLFRAIFSHRNTPVHQSTGLHTHHLNAGRTITFFLLYMIIFHLNFVFLSLHSVPHFTTNFFPPRI